MAITITLRSYTPSRRFEILPFLARTAESLFALLGGNVRLFTLFGVDFSVSASAVALPAVVFACCGFCGIVVVYLLGLVASILLHEIGHALGGYIVGYPARKICLTGFGGYTTLADLPGATGKDAVMSAFGPLANALVVLALMVTETCVFGFSPLKWLQILIRQVFDDCPSMDYMPDSFFIMNSWAIVNLYMLVFNLLPAFPLDGGRVFRSIAGRCLPPLTAAKVTLFVSRASACMVVALGVITDIVYEWDPVDLGFILFVAAWIWLGSMAEVWRTEEFEADGNG